MRKVCQNMLQQAIEKRIVYIDNSVLLVSIRVYKSVQLIDSFSVSNNEIIT